MSKEEKEVVVVLGASPKPERYSNMALRLLVERGVIVMPVNPGHRFIHGIKTFSSLKDISVPVDTITIYVGPEISTTLYDDILALKPKRVIFNPGAEETELSEKLERSGISVENACSIVLLHTGAW